MAETIGESRSMLPRMGLYEISVAGIWMRRIGDYVELLAENPVTREWIVLAREHFDSPFSHIVEPSGVRYKFDGDKGIAP